MSNTHPPVIGREPDGPRYERLLASVDEGLWEHNLVTGTAWFSRRFRHLLGFAASEWPDDPSVLRLRVHPEDLAGFDGVQQRASQNGLLAVQSLRLLCRDGQWRWFRARVRVWPDASGRPTHLVGSLHDIDGEVRTLSELKAVTQRFERAIAASEEGLFDAVWGQDKVYLSERARELLGLPPGGGLVPYADLRMRIHPDDHEQVRTEIAQAVGSLTRWQFVFRARRFDQADEYRWFRERGTAAREADGTIRVWGLVADVTDSINETERLESRVARRTAELAEALRLAESQRVAAESANRAKASFLGQMSHELRTPLNGVIGMTQLALRSGATPEQTRFLEMAQQSARSMLHVVEDLLDFARAEAGKLTLEAQPFDLSRLLADAFRSFMPDVRQRGLRMMFDYVGDPVEFIGDASRIRQMVSNVVGNAVKFTEAGQITVIAHARQLPRSRPGEADRAEVRIEIADTGPGMDPETAQRVFEPFEQADATIGRRHGGAGLGLSIVRMLADLMGGRVSVDTAVGKGSTFRLDFTLPLAPSPVRPARPPPGLAWIVFQSDTYSAWLGRRVQRLGWMVRVVVGLDGAAAAAREAPASAPQAVLVTEPALGDGRGLSALVKALPPSCPVSVLVRPDFPQASLLGQAEAMGCRVALAPFTPADLLGLLAPRPLAAQPRVAPMAPVDPGAVDATAGAPSVGGAIRGRVLVVEDNPVNRLIVREMLASLGVDCDDADSGESALAACEASAPDLVLMDIQMPGMDGLQAAQRLRALQGDGRMRHFPIIALTAHAMPGDREASLAAGMDDHLTKPIHFDLLRQAVARHLRPAGG